MKRDMDLFRALLLRVEEQPYGEGLGPIEVSGYTKEQVYYHALLAQDAGLIDASFMLGYEFVVLRLTYAGHEFLDAARQDKLWRKAKETILSNAGTLTVEALKTALSMLMQQAARSVVA